MKLDKLVARVVASLTDDLRRPPWKGSKNPLAGHCYVACEALYHLTKGRLKPQFIRVDGQPHWFLRDGRGVVCDPTASQFSHPVRYHEGVGKGFLTQVPSKRCKVVLDRCRL